MSDGILRLYKGTEERDGKQWTIYKLRFKQPLFTEGFEEVCCRNDFKGPGDIGGLRDAFSSFFDNIGTINCMNFIPVKSKMFSIRINEETLISPMAAHIYIVLAFNNTVDEINYIIDNDIHKIQGHQYIHKNRIRKVIHTILQ